MTYERIEDYGLIGDLETVALVGRTGSVDLLCLPDLDSPTVFAALLDDEQGGRFRIGPATDDFRHTQMYLPDTNVLLTRFLSAEGVGEVTDFMPVGEVRHAHCLVRRVTCVRGPVTFAFRCEPRFDYARARTEVEQRDGTAVFTAKDSVFSATGDDLTLRLHVPVPFDVVDGAVVGELTLEAGRTVDFVLEAVGADAPSPVDDEGWVDRAFQHTVDHWRAWVASSHYRGRWRDMVNRSALTMKLLTSARWGSIAAAGTFGLPEMIGGVRNWDYRFTWVRDASLTAAALIRLGFRDEAHDYVQWITERFREAPEPGRLQIMYGLDGRAELTEEVLDHLEGYRGSRPVRVGNAAYDQLQLDIYGELLHMLELYDAHVEGLSYDLWQHLRHAVEWVRVNWPRADEGVWEVRGGRQEFLYSRLMSWVAIDRAVRIAERRGLPAPLPEWRRARDEIYDDVYHEFWDERRGAFVQHKGSTTLDASALLMPLVGFISSRDPRWLSTLRAIERELVDDALVYRYLTEEAAADGLTGSEGTFCMCSYWFIECLARAGEVDRARLLFEKMHGYANHLGLYAEEMDPTGGYLGNFPQAFTHLGLTSTALFLDDALDRRDR